MFKEKLLAIKDELTSFSKAEALFVFSAMLCGFLISADYAVVRPVSNSLFISAFSASAFPYAWIAAVPLNLLIVSAYNCLIPRIGALRVFMWVTGTIIAINTLSAYYMDSHPAVSFFFYIWKEIYIMLMFQQLWSMIHSTISWQRAKYLYGIMFAIGAIGGAAGSTIPALFAVSMGSQNLLYCTVPIYLLLIATYYQAHQNSALKEGRGEAKERPSLWDGLRLISSSKILTFILLIVIAMQMSSTLIDYQFNTHLEQAIPDQDRRTAYTAKILGLVNSSTIFFQVVGTFVLLRFVGMRKSHVFIPAVLGLNALVYSLYPAFGFISYSFVTIKSFDFSLFGVIKEMLYIPLKKEEKFQAKAIIDVFAYRSAKAFSSLAILALQAFAGIHLFSVLSWWSIALFMAWCGLVVWTIKKNVISAVNH